MTNPKTSCSCSLIFSCILQISAMGTCSSPSCSSSIVMRSSPLTCLCCRPLLTSIRLSLLRIRRISHELEALSCCIGGTPTGTTDNALCIPLILHLFLSLPTIPPFQNPSSRSSSSPSTSCHYAPSKNHITNSTVSTPFSCKPLARTPKSPLSSSRNCSPAPFCTLPIMATTLDINLQPGTGTV